LGDYAQLLCFSQRQHTEDGLLVVKQLLRHIMRLVIRADMNSYSLVIARTKPTNAAVPILPSVSIAEQNAYLLLPAVAYNADTLLI